jgi:serine/threonine protein kinase
MVVEAEGKTLPPDELNNSTAWESPSPPKLKLLPGEEVHTEETEANITRNDDDDEMIGDHDEDGDLSILQSSLDASYDDNAAAEDNINRQKKKVHTPKRQKRRDVNVNPRQLQQQHLPQSDTAPSLQSSYSSSTSFTSNLFSPTPHRPQTRRMTAAQHQHQQQQQQRQRRQLQNNDNDGNGILFSPRPVDAMMSTRNRLLPPRPTSPIVTSNNYSKDGGNNNNALVDEMLDPSSPLTPSPKFIVKGGDKCKDGRSGPNLSTDTSSSSSSTLPLDKSHSFSPTNNNNETSTESTTTVTTTNMKPFRFHTFPASLPRVRPRMDGDTTTTPTTSTLRPKLFSSPATRLFHKQQQQSSSSNVNISSDCNSETGSVQSGTNERIRKSKPSFATREDADQQKNLLQLEEGNDDSFDCDQGINDDDDDESDTMQDVDVDENDLMLPQSTTTIPTRLNFSSPLPPDGDRKDELNNAKDLPKGSNNYDDDTSRTGQRCRAMTSPTTYLPTNYMALDSSHDTLETTLHPHTPRGVLFNAAISMENLEVSPITRWPEDYDEHEIMIDDIVNDDNHHSKDKSSHDVADAADMLDTSSGSLSRMIFRSIDEDHTPGDTKPSATGSTHRPTAQRKFRPMPDTSAFDVSGGGSGIVGRSINTPSQRSLGSKDSGFHSHKSRGGGIGGGGSTTSVGLLCPPTPIRTPAWAHHAIIDSIARGNDRTFTRANSLITTKVLATTACPPRVLDNLSSLEDSMLENDITGSTIDTSIAEGCGVQETSILQYNTTTNQNNALLTLDENDEHEDCNFRSLEDRSTEDESSSPPTLLVKNGETSINAGSLDDGNRNALVEEINFSDFDNLGILGSGAFADVYKVRARKGDRRLYAIKRTRRQFRGVKDRERAMAEVHTMKRLQSELLSEATAAVSSSRRKEGGSSSNASATTVVQHQSTSNYGLYLLFFIRAWQQDGFFYCQTELCSRANCRHLRLSISSEWTRDIIRYPSLQTCKIETTLDHITDSSSQQQQQYDRLIPERGIWQICHDISRGLLHIHTHGMVHGDIKPSNIFFVYNSKWGTICKIGDFGMAGDIGTKDDGQEGDTVYMPNELLLSCEKHPSADIFSLGITMYELAASPMWSIPTEGERWHEIRSEAHRPDLPSCRNENLVQLIRAMTLPNQMERPSAENILKIAEVKRANASIDSFLSRYVNDVERYDSIREREMESAVEDARRR